METLKLKGNEAYQKGDYQLAVTIYTQAIEQFPEESALLGNRSAALFMLKQYDEAEKDCQNVLQKDEQNDKVKLRLGKIYIAKGELQQAKELFQQIQNIQQIQIVDELQKYAGYHEKAVSEKNYQEGLFYINKLIEQCPAHKPFLFKKLQTLISYGQLENALAFFQSSQRDINNTVELLYWKGVIFYYMNNHQKATSCFRELLMQEPNYTQAMTIVKKIRQLESLKEQGNNSFKDKNFHEAIASYTQALDVDPEHNQYNSLILNNRSACHIGLEQYDQALKDCNKAIEIHPFNAKAYLRRGNIKLKIEDIDPNEAIQDYEKARELDLSIDIRSNVQEAKLIMKKRARKDYYKILGIKEKATEDEIRKAYKKKAIEWHPDKHSNGTEEDKKRAEKMFKDVGEAYSVLSDPQKRQRYDMGADLEEINQGFSGGMRIDPNEIFSQFFAGGNPFGGGGGFSQGGPGAFFSQGGPFENSGGKFVFNFGPGGQRRKQN